MPILQWLTREDDLRTAFRTPYRLLEESADLSVNPQGSENLLVQGDNLEALKALLPFYAGKVKCIFIDPPYNTGSAFAQYDDNLEHARWLAMMWPRLVLLREFLSPEGSIWVTIDDTEAHYLKVIMDEVFGRKNFIASCTWQKRYSRENRGAIGDAHDYLFVYARDPGTFKDKRNRIELDERQAKVYRNPENPNERDPSKRWRVLPMTAQGFRPNQMYELVSPAGVSHRPPAGRCWSMIESRFRDLEKAGRIYWGKDGKSQPGVVRYLSEVEGLVPWTWWPHDEVGHTDEAKKEIYALFGAELGFATPKPERLLHRILQIATNENDIVLDSFFGSATTGAVAHKMNRRWIGIEMGDHAVTHCVPRLKKVVESEQGGISQAVGWQGGGGFRFLRLGATVFDEAGNLTPGIPYAALAAHLWFAETRAPRPADAPQGPLLGVHGGMALALLYNGILGDRRPAGGNVLTRDTLALIRGQLPRDFVGPLVVYGEQSRLSVASLQREGIAFRQTPHALTGRGAA